MKSSAVTRRAARRLHAQAHAEQATDHVAVEEPLEIRVAGEPVAVTMRTPGDDARLAVGFLFAEGIIGSIDDVGTVAHCGRPGDEGFGNVIDVLPGAGVALDPERLQRSRRGTLTTAACGVCGRRSIADLVERCRPLDAGPQVAADTISAAVQRMKEAQPAFQTTGGTHAAAACLPDGGLVCGYEDVGRHNAVDKVVGALLYGRQVGVPAFLCVSGRTSFEIIQKAAAARVPVVVSVSAASSLAIDLAAACRITLCAFVRGPGMSVYTHPERIAAA